MTNEQVNEIIEQIEGEVGRELLVFEYNKIKNLLFTLFGEVEE